MFINLTNHPSDRWGAEQLNAAKAWGELIDMPFPQVPPEATEADVAAMADGCVLRVLSQKRQATDEVVVHIAGEHTLVYAIVSRLRTVGIRCIASTTRRVAEEDADGLKISQFRFVKFREYG